MLSYKSSIAFFEMGAGWNRNHTVVQTNNHPRHARLAGATAAAGSADHTAREASRPAVAEDSANQPVTPRADASKGKAKRGVSMYCYQEGFYNRTMTLEDCIAEASSIGAYGIEMLAEEMVPDFPNPSNQWVDHWHELMDKYGTVLDTYTQFQNTDLRKNYELSVDEGVAMLETDFKIDRTKTKHWGLNPNFGIFQSRSVWRRRPCRP
jgi:hypothetical protein